MLTTDMLQYTLRNNRSPSNFKERFFPTLKKTNYSQHWPPCTSVSAHPQPCQLRSSGGKHLSPLLRSVTYCCWLPSRPERSSLALSSHYVLHHRHHPPPTNGMLLLTYYPPRACTKCFFPIMVKQSAFHLLSVVLIQF